MNKTETNKLDKMWREKIKERDQVCQVCFQSHKGLNSHHIVGRRNRRTRWDLKNGILLCPKHHTFDSKQSAHQNGRWFHEWFEERYPERNAYLRKHENEIFKGTFEDVKKMIDK